MDLLRESYASFLDVGPGAVGFGGIESLFSHSNKKRTIAEKYPVRCFTPMQKLALSGGLADVFRLAGCEYPAVALTKQKCDVAPLPAFLEGGAFFQAPIRPLPGAATCESPRNPPPALNKKLTFIFFSASSGGQGPTQTPEPAPSP